MDSYIRSQPEKDDANMSDAVDLNIKRLRDSYFEVSR